MNTQNQNSPSAAAAKTPSGQSADEPVSSAPPSSSCTPSPSEHQAREIAEKIFLDFCGQTFFSVAESGNWLKDRISAALTRSEEEKNALEGKRSVGKLIGTLGEEDEKKLLNCIRGDAPQKHLILSLLYDLDLLPEQIRDKSGSEWWRMLTVISHVNHLQSELSTLTARLKEGEEEHGKELRQWQDAVRDKVIDLAGCPDFKIDGAGCDSGEPLEFTLTEISQGFGWVADEIVDPLKQRLKEAEGQIVNLLASAVPNAIDHPTMFAAWESARSFLTASTPVEKE